MPEDTPVHEFNEEHAKEFEPRSSYVKTAILVELANPDATVTIRAPFGAEVMKGAFYIVASPQGSYGAARAEFEDTHVEVEPCRWVKRARVQAYQTAKPCRVETWLADGTHEGTVDAKPGDWIVKQDGGEVMVLTDNDFAARYRPVR
jgi:hypothetical protein